LRETVIKKLRAEMAAGSAAASVAGPVAGSAGGVPSGVGSDGGVVEAQVIKRIVQVALNRFDTAASVHYQAFHAR